MSGRLQNSVFFYDTEPNFKLSRINHFQCLCTVINHAGIVIAIFTVHACIHIYMYIEFDQ